MNHELSFLDDINGLSILITPLNWGLGHATRSVPIIKRLKNNNKVFIASDGLSLDWLQDRFPNLPMIELPGYKVVYDHKFMWLNMLWNAPNMIQAIAEEHSQVSKIVDAKKIDLVISDHRLGCYNKKAQSVIIAHQLFIPHKSSFLSNIATTLQNRYINRFDSCWIPDYINHEFSGRMSKQPLRISKKFIGALSRFQGLEEGKMEYHAIAILSGPEPERELLENKMISLFSELPNKKYVVVRGTSTQQKVPLRSENISVYDLLGGEPLQRLIQKSRIVVCRSGYSSIMDLVCLNKKAILIPTSRHPEQEYLASLHQNNVSFLSIPQDDLNKKTFADALLSFDT